MIVGIILSVLITIEIIPQKMLPPVVLAFLLANFGYIVTRDGQLLKEVELIRKDLSKQDRLIGEIAKVPNAGVLRARLIDDPTNHLEWIEFERSLDAFNAPWTLASKELYPAFKKFINQKDFKMRVLIFEGNGKDSQKDYGDRIERLNELAEKLSADKVKTKDKIAVRAVRNEISPTTTFFLSHKHGKRISILYVYPFISGDKPMLSMEICAEVPLSSMVSKFEEYWRRGEEIQLGENANSSGGKNHAAD